MSNAFLQQVEAATKAGLSISQIEKQYGFPNRAIRRAKAELYKTGALPKPVGYTSKDDHETDNR